MVPQPVDPMAMAAAVRRYGPAIHAVCRRLHGGEESAADAACVAVFRQLLGRPGDDPEPLGAWLQRRAVAAGPVRQSRPDESLTAVVDRVIARLPVRSCDDLVERWLVGPAPTQAAGDPALETLVVALAKTGSATTSDALAAALADSYTALASTVVAALASLALEPVRAAPRERMRPALALALAAAAVVLIAFVVQWVLAGEARRRAGSRQGEAPNAPAP